ncbi:hypothetical protein ACX4ZB_04805 [Aerococcus urinae]
MRRKVLKVVVALVIFPFVSFVHVYCKYYFLNRTYRQPDFPAASQEYYLSDYSQRLNDLTTQHIMTEGYKLCQLAQAKLAVAVLPTPNIMEFLLPAADKKMPYHFWYDINYKNSHQHYLTKNLNKVLPTSIP